MRKFLPLILVLTLFGCEPASTGSTASSGVQRASVAVTTGADGLTAEQRNVRERLVEDNKPGAIKHLYVISSFTGQVLIYSTVKGKVTSGGKRLSPTTVIGQQGEYVSDNANVMPVSINGETKYTAEVLQDDGTYGSSSDYLYWWDAQGRYHQQYTEGAIIHISDQPLPIKSVTLNLEAR